VAAFLVLLLALAAQAPPPEDALAARSRAAKELMAAGRYAEAAAAYRELVKAVPGDALLLVNLGMALHLAGKDQDAIAPLESAVRRQPESLPGNLFLGASRLRLGREEDAVAPLQKAVKLDPASVDARSMLAEALLALDRRPEAEPHLRRLTELAPSDPAVWFNLGQTYEDLAGETVEAMVDRDPESTFSLVLAADARLRGGQRTAAFHLYHDALERRPGMRGVHASVAGIYRAAGHADWAAIEEEREHRLPPPDCPRAVLECLFSAGKYHDVVVAASEPGAKTSERSYWLARAYDALATRAFDRLAALPPSAFSYERRAQVARDQRRYAESIDDWRKAIAKAPGDPRLQTELAVTLRLNQDFAGAQRVLEELVRAAPDEPGPSYLLGDVLLAQQQPERAIPWLEKAVRIDSEEPHAQGALGRAYALVGRPADAIPHLKQALPVDMDGSLRLQLARAYQAAGQTELAQAARKDYEEFRKAAQAETADDSLPPPEGSGPASSPRRP
jgi:predicted Zn-dependent protease